jgi:hypothetical protein
MGRSAILTLLVGCYSPSVVPGSPCDTEADCPNELHCTAGRCGGSQSPIDAAIDGPPVAVDASPDSALPPRWSPPQLVPGVNSGSVEGDPSITPDRLTIVFTSTRLTGTEDIFIGTRATTADSFSVMPIVALNDPTADDHSPEISADGATLYFTSDRVVANNFDVYLSTRNGTTWAAPTVVPELTSASNDGDLAVSPDGLTAVVVRGSTFFRSTRASTSATWGTLVSLGSAVFGTSPAAPSLTATGDLYLHANAVRDLFVARKNGTGFTTATPITELDTTGRDAAPFVSGDEKGLVFERDGQIYESTHP